MITHEPRSTAEDAQDMGCKVLEGVEPPRVDDSLRRKQLEPGRAKAGKRVLACSLVRRVYEELKFRGPEVAARRCGCSSQAQRQFDMQLLTATPAQRAQYPLNKEYTLNYRDLNIMI